MVEEKVTTSTIHTLAQSYLGKNYNKKLVASQMKRMLGTISLEEIANALCYWYTVKKEDPEKSRGGIGIVEYICQESNAYWKRVQELKDKEVVVDEYRPPKEKSYVVPRPVFSKPKTLNLFDLK